MSTALIYVFSGSGNTLKAANLYKEQFEKDGISTTIKKITANLNPNDDNLTCYDFIGLGYPIHGFNAPYNVLDFVKRIQANNKSKKYFIFKTSGEPLRLNDCSSYKLNAIMRKKNFELTNEYHYVMPYNMIFRHTDTMAYKMLETMKQIIPFDVREIEKREKHLLPYLPFGNLLSGIFRIEHFAVKFNCKHFFRIDSEKCIKCGLCVKNCPMHNIEIKANGRFKFHNNCVMCTNCSFHCPKDAFNIGILNNWRVNGEYNFNKPTKIEKDTHKRYCKKSYQKYFELAQKKVISNGSEKFFVL